jgi:hypothetical protein
VELASDLYPVPCFVLEVLKFKVLLPDFLLK